MYESRNGKGSSRMRVETRRAIGVVISGRSAMRVSLTVVKPKRLVG